MVRVIIFVIFILFLLTSCSYTVNEFGMRRYNTSGLKPYTVKCTLLDSVTIGNGYYKLIMPQVKDEKILNQGLRKNFLVLNKVD